MSPFTLPVLGPLAWIDVVLLVWFVLTFLSVAYAAWDCFFNNPEMTVMKWGWVLVTLYLGPISLFIHRTLEHLNLIFQALDLLSHSALLTLSHSELFLNACEVGTHFL